MNHLRQGLLGVLALGALALMVIGLTALVRLFEHHLVASAEVAGAVVVAALAGMAIARQIAPRVGRGTILELDLASAPPETGNRRLLTNLGGQRALTLSDTVAALARASRDPRVGGLVLRPRFQSAPRAVVQELRDALLDFKQSGKFTVAVADTFGEEGPANSAYYLATACDEVVVHPSGLVGLAPLALEPNFYRGLFDRVGIDLEVMARHEFKSALNKVTKRGYTQADREQSQRLIDSLWGEEVEAIARSRRLDPQQVRRLADEAPLLASEALEGGLVDGLAYTDEVLASAKAKLGPKSRLVYLAAYRRRAGRGRQRGNTATVAVLRAVGEIHRSAPRLPFGVTGGPVLAADKLISEIRSAAKDSKVKAFVLRVDSPGGSAVASDAIWRELVRLRELGKPLVVSMGAVAASGGYYLATAADQVVAEPGTITGSIGVITAHPVLARAKTKLGVTADEVHTGAEPSRFSVNRPLSQVQRRRVDAELDWVYELFTRRVADGRKIPIEKVLSIAKGRVWTGADAHDIGLVDELGGLERAMALAVELSGATPGTLPRPRPVPRGAAWYRRLWTRSPESSDGAVVQAGLRQALPGWPGEVVTRMLGGSDRVLVHLGWDPRSYWLP